MVHIVLSFPLPPRKKKHLNFTSAFGAAANQTQRREMQHKKRHSQFPPKQLTSVCSSCSVWKERNQMWYEKNPTNVLGTDPERYRAPVLPLTARYIASAQQCSEPGTVSAITALSRLVSVPRTQTAWESVSNSSGSPHTSVFLCHTSVPVKYIQHSSLSYQYMAKSLSLSVS